MIKVLQLQEGSLRAANWATAAQGRGYRGEDPPGEDAEKPTDEGKTRASREEIARES